MTAFIYLSVLILVFTTLALLLKKLIIKNKLKKINPKIIKTTIGILLTTAVVVIISLIFFIFIKQPKQHEIIGLVLFINTILLFSITLKITNFLDCYREKEEENNCVELATRHYVLFVVLFILLLVA